MTTSPVVYIGPYFKVHNLPTIEVPGRYKMCPECRRTAGMDFCPYDGARLEAYTTRQQLSLYDFFIEKMGDADRFSVVLFEGQFAADRRTFIVSNQTDRNASLLLTFGGDDREIPLPSFEWAPEWSKLGEALQAIGAEVERFAGVLVYYS
ncbi:MAG: hypothetical protein IPO08_23835 [Xanthomonadales bacterium]|nr:hypothetical protein [Xanthomonadales bacterium]